MKVGIKGVVSRVICIAVSLLIFSGVCLHLSQYLPYRDFRLQMVWDDIYSGEDIDYLFVGSSHVYTAVDPFVVEDMTGGKTLLISSGVQTMAETCYSIEEALKYQSPKIVFVDLYGLYRDFSDRDYNFMNVDCMRFSHTKIKLAYSAYSEASPIDVCFPLIREHSNWKETDNIEHNKMMLEYPAENTKGFFGIDSVMPDENVEYFEKLSYDGAEFTLREKDVKYLHKIEEICKDRGVDVRFVMLPWYKGFADKINYQSLMDAIGNEIEFTDYTYACGEEMGLDHTFFIEEKPSDNQHLNIKGAKIFTKYLVETQI